MKRIAFILEPATGESPAVVKSYSAAAQKWAAEQLQGGYAQEKVTTLDLGGFALSICMDFDLPIVIALDMVDVLQSFFPDKSINPRTLFRLGLYLQANKDALKKGILVPDIDRGIIPNDFWARIQCTDIYQTFSKQKGTSVWAVTFLILDTPLAGSEFRTVISANFLKGVIRVISRGSQQKESCFPEYLLGMSTYGVLGTGSKGNLIIKKIGDATSLHNINAQLRIKRWNCKHFPCTLCPKGLDACRYAVRRVSWKKHTCPKCNKSAWLTPDGIVLCSCKGKESSDGKS